MIGKTCALLSLVVMCGTGLSSANGPTQTVLITVVNKQFEPARPVANARVILGYFDDFGKITAALKPTNSRGQTELTVSAEGLDGRDLRIEISGAEGLVIYQPREGWLQAIPRTLTVMLLAKGSPALLEPAQIRAMLDRLSLQNQHLKIFLAKAENQKPNFDQALREWATANGFSYEEVDQRVRSWAQDVLARKEKASLKEQAEAELAMRHVENAALLFERVVNKSEQALDTEEREYLAGRRKQLRDFVQESIRATSAFQQALQSGKATATADKAQAKAAIEHQHFPDDAALREIWEWSTLFAFGARMQEGASTLSQSSVQLFTSVVEDDQRFLSQLVKVQEPDKWAYAQMMLAGAFVNLSERSSSSQGADFRRQAVAASRAALEVYKKEDNPKQWAYFQTVYSTVLLGQIGRAITDGRATRAESVDSLEQATATLRLALDVYSKIDDAKDWADAQTLLAAALAMQSLLTTDKRSAELLAQAETADRAALDIFTAKEYPNQWTSTQENLGHVLSTKAEAASGAQSLDLFKQAVAIYRAVLEVRTKKQDALKWANAQSALAETLKNAGTRAGGDDAVDLLTQSAAAYREELEVITKEAFPQRWAATQTYLCGALAALGVRKSGTQSAEALEQAATACRAAFEVYTKDGYQARWAGTQYMLGTILAVHSARVASPQSDSLLQQAVLADRAALEMFTKTANPQEWTATQANLGGALAAQGQRATGSESAELFAQAAEAFSAVLESDPKNLGVLVALGDLYHEYLTDFPKSYEFMLRAETMDPSVDNRLNLAEASLTTSRFSACIDLLTSTTEESLQSRQVPARQSLLLACQWGAGQQRIARETAAAFQGYAKGIPRSGWNSAGDRKYLATAPEFKAGRSLWITLFQALEDGNGPGLAEAAQGLSELMVR